MYRVLPSQDIHMKDKKDRCWKGYEPVKGKKPYASGSCKKATKPKPKKGK